MLKKIAVAALFVVCAMPAFADEEHNYMPNCVAPEEPASINGSAASQADIDAARDAVNGFMRASDSYQQCLGREMGAQQNLAFSTHSNVPQAFVKQFKRKGMESQAAKKRTGDDFNKALVAFQTRNGSH